MSMKMNRMGSKPTPTFGWLSEGWPVCGQGWWNNSRCCHDWYNAQPYCWNSLSSSDHAFSFGANGDHTQINLQAPHSKRLLEMLISQSFKQLAFQPARSSCMRTTLVVEVGRRGLSIECLWPLWVMFSPHPAITSKMPFCLCVQSLICFANIFSGDASSPLEPNPDV